MNGYSIQQLAEIVGGRLRLGDLPPLGGAWEPTNRIVVDARAATPGDVLLATPECIATNRFCVEEAFEQGALGVISSGRLVEPWAGKFSIQVDDTQWALWQLARSARQHFDGRVIAVAGHVGKSTTLAMIDTVLGVDRVGCEIGNEALAGLESDPTSVGDRLAAQLLALHSDADYALFELHAHAAGELDTAAYLACPHIAVATAIEPSLFPEAIGEGYAPTLHLGELLSALPDDGCAIVNDNTQRSAASNVGAARWLTYGRGGNCDVQATHVLVGDGVLAFVVDGQLTRIHASGRHYLNSALAAWCVARVCGVRDADIARRLETFRPLQHRCLVRSASGVTVIDDAAGRSPIAARAALAVLQHASASGRRIAICGDFQRTFASDAAYRRLGRDCVTVGGADLVVAIGSGASAIAAGAYENGMSNSSCVTLSSPVNALCELRGHIAPGDVVAAIAVEPSLADALVAFFSDNQQRQAA